MAVIAGFLHSVIVNPHILRGCIPICRIFSRDLDKITVICMRFVCGTPSGNSRIGL